MPLLESGVRKLASRMPRVVSPKTHAIIDYAVAGSFILVGAKAWSTNKHAAISAFMIAGAELALAMVTDYPGGVAALIDLPTHLRIDTGLSGLIGTMPNTMAFGENGPSWFFRSQGMAKAALSGLTRTSAFPEARAQRRAA